jgi:hypothetical protein
MRNLIFLLLLSASVNAQQPKIFNDKYAVVREVSSFSELLIRGPFTVYFSDDIKCNLAVSCSDESVRNRIVSKVVDGQLQISYNDRGRTLWDRSFKMNIYVSSPGLKKVEASGAVTFNVHDVIKVDELGLVFSGASDFRGKIQVTSLYAVFTGASDLEVDGTSTKATYKFSGASDGKAFGLKSDDVQIISSGASNIQVTAFKSIKAVASGASDISFKGNPGSVYKSSTGASSIVSK